LSQFVGGRLQFGLEHVSRRSALRKIQLSACPMESNATIVNTMTRRHREISSPWRAKVQVQTIISTTIMISASICHLPPRTCLPVPGTCNSATVWIEHPGAYMGAYSQARLEVYFKACSGVSLRAS
jgi:hypothetical protein